MVAIHARDTVGELVARRPALARVFEKSGIDYCCGGKKSLEEVCREKDLDSEELLRNLEQAAEDTMEGPDLRPAEMALSELADHIEQTHHAYLREELPRLNMLTEKVASVHGANDPRLREVRQAFLALAGEMASHMMKEERILFPMIRQLEASEGLPAFHCGSIAGPIRQMEIEHQDAGAALEQMRALTDGYKPPTWACNTYRAMLGSLAELERDMHRHVHKEDNVLYPRALDRETQLAERAHP